MEPDPMVARQLLIMRHGKAAWGGPGTRDFDRSLTERGWRDARSVGGRLQAAGLVPDHVVCSSAQRARSTVEAVLGEMDIPLDTVRWCEDIYEATPATLLRVLGEIPAPARCVLIVGHNPGFEMLTTLLAASQLKMPERGAFFPTAGLARLAVLYDSGHEGDFTWGSLHAGSCEVLEMLRPKTIDD